MLAALAAVPALFCMGATLQVLAQPSLRDLPLSAWRVPLLRTAKLFAQGIPLAVVLFVLFPRLAGPMWGLPTDAGSKSGLSDQMAPGSISELSMSDAVAFRVDFDGTIPPHAQRYWRGPVMSRFDGREWVASDRRPPRGPRPAGREIAYWVTLEPHWKSWLFALDLPAGPPTTEGDPDARAASAVVGILTGDQRLYARTPVTQSLRYRQTSVPADAYSAGAGDALEAERAENLQLPYEGHNANPRSVAFARELRAEHPGDADYIRAVLQWFRTQEFFYTLAPPLLPGRDPVDAFLFDQRRGFCEHYASSFVVLLRAAGIPARVVTGYQGGEINPTGGYLIVRQSDAHAWAEALIGGMWRRFDPTGAVAPSRIERGLGSALPTSQYVPLLARLDDSWLRSLQLTWDAFNHDWRLHVIGFNYDKQRSLWRDWKMDRLPPGGDHRGGRRHDRSLGSGDTRAHLVVAAAHERPGAPSLGFALPASRECRLAAAGARRAVGIRCARRCAVAGIRGCLSRDRRILRAASLRSAARDGRHAARTRGRPRAPHARHRSAPRSRGAALHAGDAVTRWSYKSASRSRPLRLRRARSFSSASAWIWRTRSRVTSSSPARSSSVATSRPLRP